MPGEPPATSNNQNNIAIIQVNDWFVHIVADVAEARQQTNIGGPAYPVQFFDVGGFQLAPSFDADWQLQALFRAPGPANPGAVRARLSNWLRNYRAFVRDSTADGLRQAFSGYQPDVFSDFTPAQVLTEMRKMIADPPAIRGRPLADCFNQIRAFLVADGGDRGTMLHNAAHALGWTHA